VTEEACLTGRISCVPLGIDGAADLTAQGLGGFSGFASGLANQLEQLEEYAEHGGGSSAADIEAAARLAGATGPALQFIVDLNEGHGPAYGIADGGSEFIGAGVGVATVEAAAEGLTVCGGPEDGVSLLCAAGGAFVGSGGAHWLFTQAFG
jgi:hypothetical protein